MKQPLYDVIFSGHLLEGADVQHAKKTLQQQFKLSDVAIEKLFSGQRIVIKRGLEAGLAQRYREIFNQAGALAQLVAQDVPTSSEPEPSTPAPVVAKTVSAPAKAIEAQVDDEPGPDDWFRPESDATAAASSGLTLAPTGATLDQLSDIPPAPPPNTSHLSLVDTTDWTLEDCAPPPLPQPLPDIDSLALEPITKP
jgi:hypothetical protein